MSASTPSNGRIAAENELLARLGLPPSATTEDVDQAHLAVSQFLAAAPPSIRGWARAQAAQLDAAYLSLTDPVGLEGSALRSPTRPPTVVPGGPATPPARRDPVPAVMAAAAAEPALEPETDEPEGGLPEDDDEAELGGTADAAADDTDTDDLDALFASVTPGAHRDLTSGGKPDHNAAPPASAPKTAQPAARSGHSAPPVASPTKKHTRAARSQPAGPVAAPAPASSGPWKLIAVLASAALAVVLVVGFVVPFVFSLGASSSSGPADASSASASPAIDMAMVQSLMQKITANPKDTASLQQLGDLYFQASDYTDAATFYDKLLAIDPNNIQALLARGATYYNANDNANAEKTWKLVVALKPTNKSDAQEVHYDLGFLYLNATTPNWTGVVSEWNQVIAIDPTTQLAQTVQQHLTSLAQASMLPASLAPAASGSPAASGAAGSAPAGSGAASPTASSAPSAAPSATAPASPAPSGSAAP